MHGRGLNALTHLMRHRCIHNEKSHSPLPSTGFGSEVVLHTEHNACSSDSPGIKTDTQGPLQPPEIFNFGLQLCCTSTTNGGACGA